MFNSVFNPKLKATSSSKIGTRILINHFIF